MSKPYDATSKDLLEVAPAGWVAYLGGPPAADATVIDADLATVTTEADRVVRVAGSVPWLLHLEFQASADADLPERLLRYNALLHARHRLPAASVAVLLRPAANHSRLTGELPVAPPLGPAWAFRYTVVKVWERPADEFLAGAVGLVPFAPLAAVTASELGAVVDRMRERVGAEPLAARLLSAAYLLGGLKYDRALLDRVFAGVLQMEESVTYQAILERGGIRELRAMLLRMGQKRFGPPPPHHEAVVKSLDDLPRLEALSERLLDVATWDDLLAGG